VIGGKAILWHIMKHYARYGFHEFILAWDIRGADKAILSRFLHVRAGF
jgi:NDP-sugar pyrophosphorylase family protein